MKDNPSSDRPIRIMLVDDHNVVRRGLAALLEMEGGFEVVAEAEDGETALRRAGEVQPDVVMLDLSMPRLNGLETARRLRRQLPQTQVLVLSMHEDEEFVAQALQAGAGGYVLKRSMEEELFLALRAVANGNVFVSPAVARPIVDEYLRRAGPSTERSGPVLTSREREVLQLIAEGRTTTEVAQALSISPHTAVRHRANLMQKLGVHNQTDLIRLAIERGLVVLDNLPGPL
jgi:DNA-binding NarL/FixJ family response regulator